MNRIRDESVSYFTVNKVTEDHAFYEGEGYDKSFYFGGKNERKKIIRIY